MRLRFSVVVLACVLNTLFAAGPKKIVFVAGPKDHSVPGRHEYEKDVTVLKYCLDHSPNVKGLVSKIYTGQVPEIADLQDASVIVLESSGDRLPAEHHVLFPQNALTDGKTYDAKTQAYLDQFDKLMKKGVGLVVFHYATWVDNEKARQYWTEWLGGFFVNGTSKWVQSTWKMSPVNERHPVLSGIGPWTYDEEVYVKERLPEDRRRTELIIGTPQKGDATVASWALERKGGGRSFAMTGVDWHKNLAVDTHRKLLLNGIVWAAHVKVPAGGVQSTVPEEIMK